MSKGKGVNIRKLAKEIKELKKDPTVMRWTQVAREMCCKAALKSPKKKLRKIAELIPYTQSFDIDLEEIQLSALNELIAKEGADAVRIRLIEEAAELIQALTKSMRGRDNEDNVYEEIADVKNILVWIGYIYGIDPQDPDPTIDKIQYVKMYRDSVRLGLIEGDKENPS